MRETRGYLRTASSEISVTEITERNGTTLAQLRVRPSRPLVKKSFDGACDEVAAWPPRCARRAGTPFARPDTWLAEDSWPWSAQYPWGNPRSWPGTSYSPSVRSRIAWTAYRGRRRGRVRPRKETRRDTRSQVNAARQRGRCGPSGAPPSAAPRYGGEHRYAYGRLLPRQCHSGGRTRLSRVRLKRRDTRRHIAAIGASRDAPAPSWSMSPFTGSPPVPRPCPARLPVRTGADPRSPRCRPAIPYARCAAPCCC